MNVGSNVKWSSQSGGSFPKEKQGEIVIVVPPCYQGNKRDLFRSKGLELEGFNTAKLTTGLLYRPRESYIVAVKSGKTDKANPLLYWPRVSDLHIVQGGE